MPQTESIWQNEILLTVPLGFKDLSARKLELDRITDGDPELISAMYDQIAEEYEAMNYHMNAEGCHRKAFQWRQKR